MSRYVGFVVGLCLVLIAGCAPKADIEAETAAIESVLADYIASVEKEDLELYGRTVAPDPATVHFGTFGAPIVGWASLRKTIEAQNEALSETSITASDESIHVTRAGDFAWATSLWTFKTVMAGKPLELPVRCSWVLEQYEGRWRIVHFHKSIAAG